MSDPVPRHLRNPRRAYDRDGSEFPPMDIANARQNGATGLWAFCTCGHEGIVPLDRFRDDTPVPDAGDQLRCSACGRKGVDTRPAWGSPPAEG